MSTVDVGEICSLLAISSEINDHCAPSLNRILAWVLLLPAIMGATAVFSMHVGFWEASEYDVGIRNPPVVVVGVLSEEFSSRVQLSHCCRGWCGASSCISYNRTWTGTK